MKYISLLIIAVLGFTNVHCSKSKSSKTKRYYTNGDPLTLVEGTTMSTGSITESNYQEFDGYYLSDAVEFTQKSEVQTMEERLAGQAGSEDQEETAFTSLPESLKFTFKVKDIGGVKKYIYSSDQLNISFISKDGHLIAESGTSEATDILDLKIQHISVKKDRSAFSLMVFVPKDVKGNKNLVALTFTKPFDRVEQKATGDFDFLSAKNVKIRWPRNQNITLNVCNSKLKSSVHRFESSMNLWSKHINSTSFDVKYLDNPPPFSDLNTHCIYLVDNYFTTGSEDYANMASTYTRARNNFLDSDIFIFEKELRKVRSSVVEWYGVYEIFRVMTHEIGHFLGMGHPTNLLNPSQKTIMSYAKDNTEIRLYPRDIESIQELYK
ncbi:MAG: matrixin family metalloprotease [Bdellovibrionota bacterium]